MNHVDSDAKRQKLNPHYSSNTGDGNVGDNELTRKYGMGAQLMFKMGYISGEGLGKGNKGRVEPVSAVQRANPSVGLGVFSMMGRRNEEDEWSANSSSDEESPGTGVSSVIRKSTINFNQPIILDQTTEALRNVIVKIKQMLVSCNIENVPPNIQQIVRSGTDISAIEKSKLNSLESTLKDLKNVQDEISLLSNKINLIKPRVKNIDLSEDIYKQLYENHSQTSRRNTDYFFSEQYNLILKLPDTDTVDILLSKLVDDQFNNITSDSDSKRDVLLSSLGDLVQVMSYTVDLESHTLNRFQTSIFKSLYPFLVQKLQDLNFCESLDSNKDDFEKTLYILFNCENILKFICCWDPLIERYLYPKLQKLLQGNSFEHHISNPAILSKIMDLTIILPFEMRKKIAEILTDLFRTYCGNWLSLEMQFIDPTSIFFLKEIIGLEVFEEIITQTFLPKFYSQIWEPEFDLIAELELGIPSDSQYNSGSIFAIKELRKYRLYFSEKQYECFIRDIFSDIQMILQQWIVFGEKTSSKSHQWYNNIINECFVTDPSNIELKYIKETLTLLQKWKSEDIDDIQLKYNIYDDLFPPPDASIQEVDEIVSVRHIPMRKITITMKEVVQDYCEQHGYLLIKQDNKYSNLPASGILVSDSSLVPIFKIQSPNGSTRNIAIKNDIVWLENSNTKQYEPIYLWELKL